MKEIKFQKRYIEEWNKNIIPFSNDMNVPIWIYVFKYNL